MAPEWPYKYAQWRKRPHLKHGPCTNGIPGLGRIGPTCDWPDVLEADLGAASLATLAINAATWGNWESPIWFVSHPGPRHVLQPSGVLGCARHTKACKMFNASKRSKALLGWLRYLLRLTKVPSVVSKVFSCSGAQPNERHSDRREKKFKETKVNETKTKAKWDA